jgi:small subunit ribosomal protein S1
MIETTIISISGGTVFLQLGGKSEGILDASEVSEEDGSIKVNVGDTIRVFFLAARDGELRFTTRISGDEAGSAMLKNAFENAIPVEGRVEKEIKGGFDIKIGETRAFCPFSQMGRKRSESSDEWLGKTLQFKILEFRENGRSILVSHRAILEEENAGRIAILKTTLKEGMKVTGTVTSIQDFGAFVDIQGVQALLPISEIQQGRLNDVAEVLTPGQEIEAVVLSIDWDRERIGLSMKALLPDPWENAARKYPPGSRHKGEIARLTDYGAFVTLEPGLDGLIHVSELTKNEGPTKPRFLFKKGEKLNIEIISVDPNKQRIALKPASLDIDDDKYAKYIENADEENTYNPFAQLMKNRKEKG